MKVDITLRIMKADCSLRIMKAERRSPQATAERRSPRKKDECSLRVRPDCTLHKHGGISHDRLVEISWTNIARLPSCTMYNE